MGMMGMPGPMELLIIGPIFLLFSAAFLAVPIIGFWIICQKAGVSPLWSLLVVIPPFALFVPLLIGVMEWPALRQRSSQSGSPFSSN